MKITPRCVVLTAAGLALGGVLFGCTGSVNNTVQKIDPNTMDTLPYPGIIYPLPMTRVTVEVPVTATIVAPGAFVKEVEEYEMKRAARIKEACDVLKAQGKCSTASEEKDFEKKEQNTIEQLKFALKGNLYNLGIEYPTKNSKTKRKFKLGTPTLSSDSVPDSKQVYIVKVGGGPTKDTLTKMTFSQEGFLSGASSEVKDKTAELLIKAVEVGAGIVGKVVGLGQSFTSTGLLPTAEHRNPYSKALDITESIRDLRQDKRSNLNPTNVINLSTETFKAILEEIDKQDASLTAHFWRKQKLTWKATRQYLPEFGTPTIELLETVVDAKGKILYLQNGSSELLKAIPKQFLRAAGGPTGTPRSLAVVQISKSSYTDQIPDLGPDELDNLGFRYRLPELAVYSVRDGNRVLAQSEVPVAQFGKVVSLPSKPGSSQSKFNLKLYEQLGSPQEIGVETTAVSVNTIEGAGSAAGAIIDIEEQRRAIKAAEKEAESEKAKLEREVELLRLQKDKRDLEEALAQ